MKKRLMAAVLAAALGLSLAACGGTQSDTSTADNGSDSKAETEAQGDATEETEAASDPSEWPVIKVEVCSFSDTLDAEADIEQALNEYLVSIDAGVQADLLPIAIGDRSTTLTLMLADTSNPIDLYAWRWYSTVSDLVKNDQCISLEQYRDEYPEVFNLFPEAVYKTCQVNGEQYSIPAADSFGNFQVYAMNKDIAEEIGADEYAGQQITVEQLEEFMAKAEELHPDMCWQGDMNVYPLQGIDNLGDTAGIGVLMDRGVDQDTIVNYYETEEFKDYVTMCRDWEEKGYFVDDPLNNGYAGYSLMNDGIGGGYLFEAYSIDYAQSLMKAQITSCDTVIFQVSDPGCTNSCVYNGWQISTVCKNPDAAMKLLSLMYTDETVLRFFSLGIEGQQYEVDENGCAWYPDGVDSTNCGWNCSAPWFYPNECLSLPFETDYAEYYSGMVEFWTDPDNQYSSAMGFVFDNTDVYDEYTACVATVNEYRESLYCGQVDVDSYLEKFNEELKADGIDDVIAEMNKQYTEFLAQ